MPISRIKPDANSAALQSKQDVLKSINNLFKILSGVDFFKNPEIEAIQIDNNGSLFCKRKSCESYNFKQNCNIPSLNKLFQEMHTLRISRRCFLESRNGLKKLLTRYKDLLEIQSKDYLKKNYLLQTKSQPIQISGTSSSRHGCFAFHLPDERSIFNEHILSLLDQREVEGITL